VSAGAITCWGIDTDISRPPDGRFTALSAGSTHTCALREADSSIACWGQNTYGESSPPPGSFAAVAAGNRHTCGIRKSDRSIVCWGNDAFGMLNAPEGSFSSISAGDDFTCAVRSGDHSIVCWGYDVWGQTKPPAGAFLPYSEGLSARGSGVCAIREGYSAIVCWGLAPDPPAGTGIPPVSAGRATLTPRDGSVRIVAPGGNASVVLSWATDVGLGTEINASRGRLEVSAAVGTRGLRSLTVSGGVVRLTQIKRGGLQLRAIKGTVTVSDRFTHKTIRLRTGQSYTAR
jgi:hypothetical protein